MLLTPGNSGLVWNDWRKSWGVILLNPNNITYTQQAVCLYMRDPPATGEIRNIFSNLIGAFTDNVSTLLTLTDSVNECWSSGDVLVLSESHHWVIHASCLFNTELTHYAVSWPKSQPQLSIAQCSVEICSSSLGFCNETHQRAHLLVSLKGEFT